MKLDNHIAQLKEIRAANAEATVKFAILSAIVSQWHKKEEPNFAELLRDAVFEEIFAPHLKWATKQHLATLSKTQS